MKALQDIYVANEGVIRRLRKHQEIEKKEWAQYLKAIRTLNKELMAKTAALTKETRQHEEVEKAKNNLATELASLCKQMQKAKADAMAKFRVSQTFFDLCDVYYGVGFNDCLSIWELLIPILTCPRS